MVFKLSRFLLRATAIIFVIVGAIGILKSDFSISTTAIITSLILWLGTSKSAFGDSTLSSIDFEFVENTNRIKVNANLHIIYRDGEGNLSERDIHVFAYDPQVGYLHARDSISLSKRTFRLDRIKEAIDQSSGEMIELDSLKNWIEAQQH